MASELTMFGYQSKDIIHSYKDFENNFILGEHICKGAQGSLSATSPRNTQRYKNNFYLITKSINISDEPENILKSLQEYILMRKLNMIHYNGISYGKNNKQLLLTMEMLEYNLSDAVYFNLDNNIHDFKCIHSDYGLKYLILEVTSFLYQLHNMGFIHFDLKPDNIMFRNGKNEHSLFYGNGFKVIDLGLTEYVGSKNGCIKLDCFVGTKGWSAPEIYKTDANINCKSDIWSLAVIILFVLNGYNILDTFDITKQKNNNFINSHLMNLYLTNKMNFKLYDLLSQMFEYNPNLRPTAKDIFKHSYFDGLVFEANDHEFYCYRNEFRFVSKTKHKKQTIQPFLPLTRKIRVKNNENNK